jgi:hypothetical protein
MLSLIRRKACRRCGGDLSIECDVYGIYIECIQCGAIWNKEDLKLVMTQKNGTKLKTVSVKPLATSAQR